VKGEEIDAEDEDEAEAGGEDPKEEEGPIKLIGIGFFCEASRFIKIKNQYLLVSVL
jgi:hypothetical protein